MSVSTTAGLPGAQAYDRPTAGEDAHTILINRVSWGAIFAGVVVGLVVQVLLTMLGVGIGVATLDPGAGDNPAVSTFSIATGLWYVLSGIIAAFAGGYIAARMSGKTVATTGALHGLTSWAFTTLLVLYLLSTAVGGIVGGAFNGITSAVGGLGQTVAADGCSDHRRVQSARCDREPGTCERQRSGGAERRRDECHSRSGDR